MFQRLCDTPLWDATYLNSSRPDFTECFQFTILNWLVIASFVVYLPFWIYSAAKETDYCVSVSLKLILKTSFTTLLAFIEFYKLLNATTKKYESALFIITPALYIITYVMVIMLIHLERSNGQRPSIFLFTFWFINSLVASLLIRSHILKLINSIESSFSPEKTLDEYIYKHRSYTLEFFKYWLIVSNFLLSFLTENAVKLTKSTDKNKLEEYPEQRSWIWSRLTFSWLSKLVWKTSKLNPFKESLWAIDDTERSKFLTTRLEKVWQPRSQKYLQQLASYECRKYKSRAYGVESKEEEQISLTGANSNNKPQVRKPSLALCLILVFHETFLAGGLLKLARDCAHLIMPLVLDKLIDYFKSRELNYLVGLFYAGLLFLCLTLRTFFSTHHDNKMAHLGVRIRTSLINLIYKKSLVLSCTSRRESSIGEMTNLMATNANNFVHLALNMQFVWSSPFQIFVGLFILWQYLGIASLAGLAVLILMVSVNVFFTDMARKLFIKKLTYQDSKLRMISELLSGIKIIKLYGWEHSFNKIIGKIRAVEVKYLTKSAILNCLFSFTWDCSPFFVSSASVCTFVLINGDSKLDVNTVFVSLTIFELIKLPITILPLIVSEIVQARVSIERIQNFLLREEFELNRKIIDLDSDMAISLRRVDFGWYKSDESILKCVNLDIKKGSLIGVIGKVGSGKSSLLQGILGEMYILNNGELGVNGSVAYVSQQAWIQNDTVRNNILFGSKYNQTLYKQVISDCCLEDDFKLMPNGDQTEIGERGINLSGGQKQRLSLARACYSDSDIYLLDDPLSAVDSNVGRHIFEHVISSKGILKHKTRIFVTNLLQYLSDLDSVLIVEDGKIIETESFSDLKEISLSIKEQKEKELTTTKQISVKGIVDEEKVETGNVQGSTFLLYIKSSHFGLFALYILLNVIITTLIAGSNFWLSDWSNHRRTYSTSTRLIIFNLIGFFQCVICICAEANHTYMFVRAVKLLHDNMVFSLLRSKLSFFESTPSGRILNRFSKDVSVLEKEVPDNLKSIVSCLLNCVLVVIIISIATPLFVIGLIPLIMAYLVVQRYFVACTRQLKRLESTTRSPIFNHFSETLSGLTTVRAYKAEKRFVETMEDRIDENLIYFYPNSISYRWLAIRLEMIGNCITLFASVFSVFSARHLSEGLLALSISYSLTVPGALSWFVRTFSEFESDITSLERINEFTHFPKEDAWEIRESKPSEDWPSRGEIEFKNFYLKYRPELDYVLQGIHIRIAPGEKIGIVGRTGAGKSSLTLGLFRLCQYVEGSILIDNVDISQIGLHDLRKRLTIIPQDPVVFSGSLRMNLDPFEKHTESELWNVLELTHLKQFVLGLENKLDYKCSEGGENLSVGQRQLICLARALLRKTKVLILDEATASVDQQTDELIQRTLRSEFCDCTVLTIAHRLNTILDSNKIMVLNKGVLVEFGNPKQLLDNKSYFYEMIKAGSQ